MSDRKPISKKLRFEVFKRDKFTCQYCGRSAPEIILQLDHIKPVAAGGENDILNLITSCHDCNAGKSDRELDDHTALAKRKAQLDELQERREQLEMMLQWQRGLSAIEDEALKEVAAFWNEYTPGYCLNEKGLEIVQVVINRFGVQEVLDSMRKATRQYLKYDEETGELMQPSIGKALEYVGRICAVSKRSKTKPYLRDLYYIRGIMRNRYWYVNEWQCIQWLEEAYLLGASIEELRDLAFSCRNWTQWRDAISGMIEYLEAQRETDA